MLSALHVSARYAVWSYSALRLLATPCVVFSHSYKPSCAHNARHTAHALLVAYLLCQYRRASLGALLGGMQPRPPQRHL